MEKYRIVEQRLFDGRVQFTPQISNENFLSGWESFDRCKTLDDAKESIKSTSMIMKNSQVVEEIIHEIN